MKQVKKEISLLWAIQLDAIFDETVKKLHKGIYIILFSVIFL